MNISSKDRQFTLMKSQKKRDNITKILKLDYKYDAENKKLHNVALALIKGVGGQTFQKMIGIYGSSEQIFDTNIFDLIGKSKINIKIAKDIVKKKTISKAEELINYCKKNNITLLTYTDAKYPSRLRNIYNPPALLYCKGNVDLNQEKIISIVGTRKASNYGKSFIDKLLVEIKANSDQVTIVSGLARGIDYVAHKTAIENNLPTIGVLPCSIEEIYPRAHYQISEKIKNQGCLLSEYGPYVSKERYCFPARNRIIAGLSDLTLIVEAGRVSGAIITANYANEYNREVFAVPGDVGRSKSEGCNKLIFNHKAHIATNYDDIKYIMNWDFVPERLSKKSHGTTIVLNHKKKSKIIDITKLKQLNKKEKQAISSLENYGSEGAAVEKLKFCLKITMEELSAVICKLEIYNFIDILPGSRIALKN